MYLTGSNPKEAAYPDRDKLAKLKFVSQDQS